MSCAVDVQQSLARAKTRGIETLPYRIGVHVGHVYPNGQDLLGETVNIAARLESLAYPGASACRTKSSRAFEPWPDLRIEAIGAQIAERHSRARSKSRASVSASPITRPGAASSGFGLAVLPFQADPEDRHWGEGLADDLITALSRFSTLAVLSRASTFGFDPGHDPQQRRASALGVRYVVTGAVRLSPSRLRLQAALVEGASGRVLWAERYDRAAADALEVQDELIETIVATLVGRLEQTGAATAIRKRPESLGSLRSPDARHAPRRPSGSGLALAAPSTASRRRLRSRPDYPAAMAMLALMRLRDWALHPGESDLAEVARLAARALTLDPADSWCHLVAGQIDMYRKRLDAAEVHHKKAYALNPYDARILALWSPLATYLGKPDEGRKRIEKAMALNPHHPAWYATNLGLACYCSSAYADGAAVYAQRRRASGRRPGGPRGVPRPGRRRRRRRRGARRAARDGAELPRGPVRRGIGRSSSLSDREHLLDGLLQGRAFRVTR